jgi:branched-chain amino acid transport system substrate-binding protein
MRASTAVLVAVGLCFAGGAAAQEKEVLITWQCDRTGPTQIVGVVYCPAIQDYIDLINSKGGIEGYKIKSNELDNEYKVPQAVEEYERQKQMGAVSMMIYGTPQAQALNQKLVEDKIPGTSPGFGISASADGTRFPYLFPIAATYWSQAAGRSSSSRRNWAAASKAKRSPTSITTIRRDTSRSPVLEDLQKIEGFEMRSFAVPPPGVEMGAQVLDIAQRYRPDFVINHLFGRSPSVAIKEYKRAGYPLSKVMGLVWASAEADILAAGGWAVAEGYHTLQFAGAGDDYPIREEIKAMYKAQGKEPPKGMDDTVVYNRAILNTALHVEAIRNAIKRQAAGSRPAGRQKGFEAI